MIWPRVRGSPWARWVSARADRVAQTATLWVAEQGGELGHGVGRGAQRDPAVCFGSGAAVDHGGRVEGVGESLGLGDQAPVAPALVAVAAVGQRCAQLRIDDRAVLGGQAGGLAGDDGGAPLREPGSHRGQGVRHLASQRAGESEEPGAAGGGLAAGQGELGGHAAALLAGGRALVAVLGADRVVEVDGEAGLDRAGVGLEVFEVADGGDAFGVRQSGIGQGGDLGVEVGCGHAAV
jgi:hypothetical protein